MGKIPTVIFCQNLLSEQYLSMMFPLAFSVTMPTIVPTHPTVPYLPAILAPGVSISSQSKTACGKRCCYHSSFAASVSGSRILIVALCYGEMVLGHFFSRSTGSTPELFLGR